MSESRRFCSIRRSGPVFGGPRSCGCRVLRPCRELADRLRLEFGDVHAFLRKRVSRAAAMPRSARSVREVFLLAAGGWWSEADPPDHNGAAGHGQGDRAATATATLERRMARHNREGRGLDQLGNLWRISYQPDWFRLLKLSRPVPGGRRSSRTLCRNPARTADAEPGRSVRTRITAADGSVDVAVSIEDATRSSTTSSSGFGEARQKDGTAQVRRARRPSEAHNLAARELEDAELSQRDGCSRDLPPVRRLRCAGPRVGAGSPHPRAPGPRSPRRVPAARRSRRLET